MQAKKGHRCGKDGALLDAARTSAQGAQPDVVPPIFRALYAR
jgi:hypothetical protein